MKETVNAKAENINGKLQRFITVNSGYQNRFSLYRVPVGFCSASKKVLAKKMLFLFMIYIDFRD
jgi:hypothetical protein